ncbi:hypothetical protein C2U69_34275 [Cupriavidus pinatubonensis]|nr:hypothetical protein C2U69_34275 [Cupriavidus pinatubonensis]
MKTAHAGLPEADFIPTASSATASSSAPNRPATTAAQNQTLSATQTGNRLTTGLPTVPRGAAIHGKIASTKDATPVLYVFDAKAGE